MLIKLWNKIEKKLVCWLFRTVFPRIVVHAPVYETEAKMHFFYLDNIGPFRISACHCRNPKLCFDLIWFYIKMADLETKTCVFTGFQRSKILIGFLISAWTTMRGNTARTDLFDNFPCLECADIEWKYEVWPTPNISCNVSCVATSILSCSYRRPKKPVCNFFL